MGSSSAVFMSQTKRSNLQVVRSRIVDKASKSRSTVMHIAQAVLLVERWYHQRQSDTRKVETLPPEILDGYLADFFTHFRKPNGTPYDPRSLSSFRSYLARYLKDYNYPESIACSPCFGRSQQAFAMSKKMHLARPKDL